MIPLNASKQFISSHGLVSGVLRAAIFLALICFATRARAEVVATTSAEPSAKLSCVFTDLKPGEDCPAYSTARSLEFLGMGEEAIIFAEQDAPIKTAGLKNDAAEAKPERVSMLASARIEDSVLLEQIDENDAMLLEREVQDLSGARYELPKTRAEVKKVVGFPDSAEVASDDWIEMLRVHAEMTLSLSQNASQFLLEQMGLASSSVTAVATSSSTNVPLANVLAVEESHPAVVETH
ncbi:hypothetical protein BH10BDE1_BH10BDE1_09850 [soil metagenome]